MFARHHAWLHSKPSKQPVTRYEHFSAADEKSQLLNMPEIEFGQYILDYAFEIGPTKSSGMGPAAIEWPDIQAWSNLTKTDINPWESLVILEISKALIQQYYASEGSVVPAPYQPADFDRPSVSKRIGATLRGLLLRSPRRS